MTSRAVFLLATLLGLICGCSTASAPAVVPPHEAVGSPVPVWRIAQDRSGLFVVCAQCGQPTPKSAWHAQGPSASGLPPIITIPTVVLAADARSAPPRAPRTTER